jgi:hypothetical protein
MEAHENSASSIKQNAEIALKRIKKPKRKNRLKRQNSEVPQRPGNKIKNIY